MKPDPANAESLAAENRSLRARIAELEGKLHTGGLQGSEERRRRDELRLWLALDAAYLISFEWDIQRDEVRRLVSVDPALPPTLEEQPATLASVVNVVHPEDRELFRRNVNAAIENADGEYKNEFRVIHPDGKVAWLFERGRVERDADGRPLRLIGLSQDITERKQTEAALRASERFNQAVLDSLPAEVAVLDEEAVVLAVNARWRAFGDAAGGSLDRCGVGMNYLDVCRRAAAAGDGDASLAEDGIARVLRREAETFTMEYACGTPQERLWFVMQVLRPSPPLRGVIVTHWSITDRKLAEEALRAAKQSAEDASRSKDAFLAALSHELRTPLTPVLMAAAAARRNPTMSAEVREDFAMIERNVALEVRLIDDLLDLTRITRGKVELRIEPCDANWLLGLVVEMVRGEARDKNIEIALALNASARILSGDRARLQQVFWNLLRNAVKFTPRGGHILISSHDCPLESDTPGSGICIEVRDSGVGFDAEAARRIFEPFEQGDRESGHRFGGLGLGLAIARAIVTQHHGRIWAESDGPGHGATFTVQLPASRGSTTPEVAAPGGSEPAPARPSERPMRLLLVEDHEPTLIVLMKLLREAGHSVHGAASVQAARQAAAEQRFDAVISDLGLPDGTGLELMSELRAQHGLRGIAVSGYGMENDVQRSLEGGFAAHLVKPIDFEDLRAVLGRLHEPAAKSNAVAAYPGTTGTS